MDITSEDICMNTTKMYINLKDQIHRLEGPAIEYSNGNKDWFLLDKCLKEK